MNFQLRLLRGLQTNVREIESKPPEKFKHKCGLQMYSSDLVIPITWKSGGFEKKSRKTWRLGPQTGRFPKYASN